LRKKNQPKFPPVPEDLPKYTYKNRHTAGHTARKNLLGRSAGTCPG